MRRGSVASVTRDNAAGASGRCSASLREKRADGLRRRTATTLERRGGSRVGSVPGGARSAVRAARRSARRLAAARRPDQLLNVGCGIEAVRPAFDRYVHGDEVRFTAACWMVSARADANAR